MSRETGTSSATAALHDVYDQLESKLRPIRERFELPPDALGIAVFEGDRFLGVDVFDRPGALRHYWKCLVDSFALDWLARSARCGVCAGPTLRLGELLDEIGTGTWTEHASPGAGTDCRLDHDRLTGSALVWDGRSTVHLQVFPKE